MTEIELPGLGHGPEASRAAAVLASGSMAAAREARAALCGAALGAAATAALCSCHARRQEPAPPVSPPGSPGPALAAAGPAAHTDGPFTPPRELGVQLDRSPVRPPDDLRHLDLPSFNRGTLNGAPP